MNGEVRSCQKVSGSRQKVRKSAANFKSLRRKPFQNDTKKAGMVVQSTQKCTTAETLNETH